jgi:PAS domain S-box-containing protein
MFRVLLCVSRNHDWRLVLVAAVMCVVAAASTLFLYAKTPAFPPWRRLAWLSMLGLVAGSGIWTTHFVGMLAFKTGLPTAYAPGPTIGSFVLAAMGCALGFGLASSPAKSPRSVARVVGGGLVLGASITLMHYVGMAGYRTAGDVDWDQPYVAASVFIGALFGTGALVVAKPGDRFRRQAAAAALLTLAIVGMHFTGMTAITIRPDPTVVVPANLFSDTVMAAIAVVVSALIIAAAVAGVAFDQASRNGNLKRLREALDVMPEGLAFYDASDRLVAWNTQYADLGKAQGVDLRPGMPFEELLQTGLTHGAYPEAKGRESEWLAERQAMRSNATPAITQQIQGGRWLRITEARTGDGGVVSVNVDITDMKRAEAAIAEARDAAQEQARRVQFAERLARLGHWRMELSSGQITWSSTLYEIYGLDPNEPLDLITVMAMAHPEDAAAGRARVERQQQGQREPENTITRIRNAAGDVRHLAINSCAEFDAEGAVVAIVGTAIDVTDQKRLEIELRHARAEAEAAASVKSEFLANMSHELRTPLTSIVGFNRLTMEQPDLSELTRDYVERVEHASRALLCTVNDILDFSKLEAGQVTIHPQPTSLGALARSTVSLFEPQAGAKDLYLLLDIDQDAVVMLDPDRVRQVLLNLIGIAVKFTTRGRITLTVRHAEDALLAAVTDTGAGIAPEKLDRLFQRFSQIDGSLTRAQGGTGLGLAICKGLVEAMGGAIGVESTPGQGSRFWFSIPAALSSQPLAAAQTEKVKMSLAGLRILVADDHPSNRELARLFLTGAGADLSEAKDGQEAVEMAGDWPYDAILMDMQMPRLDGPAAVRRIRSNGPNITTPILAFTAAADTVSPGDLAQAGFDGVVTKPMDVASLIEAIGRATAYMSEPLVAAEASEAS